MITLLSKFFIKSDDVKDGKTREKYGLLCGIVGIILNIIISAAKIAIGIITGAISIVADGLNNVSDAGSSIIGMVGLKLSNKPIDKKHPFGHGRMEYISAFIVAILIIVVGVELAITSIENIITPIKVDINVLSVIILSASVLIKLYMFCYNYKIGKKINSSAMRATAMDSISDAVSTLAVLCCALIAYFTKVSLDAYAGLLVSLFILFTGIKTVKETINILIGEAPDPSFVREIVETVKQYPIVCGIHDLVVHNYGVGRCMITLHVEVSATCDIMHAHDSIDNIEKELSEKFNCNAVIHMDPVLIDDPRTNQLHDAVKNIVRDINPNLSIHDFRMNEGPTHTNIIFDVVIPHELKNNETEIIDTISYKITSLSPTYNSVINVDYPFADEYN